jgi:hypothetical protein
LARDTFLDGVLSAKTIRAYQDLLAGKSDAFDLIDQVHALEKLGVTEGTLAER